MLTDAHCHPTDDPSSLHSIQNLECRMAIMSTRFDDLDIVARQALEHPQKIVPAFGIHPWYSHLLATSNSNKKEHYQSVLEPIPETGDKILGLLPEPIQLYDHINRIRALLVAHPSALLGEVGLDKAFKIKMNGKITHFKVKLEHQRQVLREQLKLAAELHRSVSLHGVQAPQALLEEVLEIAHSKEIGTLGNICLHSYSGSPDFYVNHWQKKLNVKVFISIAILINGKMQPHKIEALIRAVKPEFLLSESDYNKAGDDQISLVQKSVNLFSHQLGVEPQTMEKKLEENFNTFISP